MKKLIAVALSSTALLAAPAVFAQATAPGTNMGGDGGMSSPGMSNPPLTPSQMETSEGAIYNPPPIDHSGNPEHVTDKDISDGGGDTDNGSVGDGNGSASGSGSGDTAAGDASGAGADSGAAAGDGAGAGEGGDSAR